MFNYTPVTLNEAMQDRFQLLKEGIYDAVIESSQDRLSSSGNPMLDMMLQVYDENGKAHAVRDFLVFTKGMMWKVVHFAAAAKLVKEYEEGKLCSEVAVGATMRVKICIDPGSLIPEDKLNGKALGSKYPDKNKVEEYVCESNKTESSGDIDNNLDDDVPF